MKTIKADLIRKRKRRIKNRLERSAAYDRGRPMLNGGNTTYELAQKASGTAYGGVAAIHAFAKKIGLPKRIDDALHLFVTVHGPVATIDPSTGAGPSSSLRPNTSTLGRWSFPSRCLSERLASSPRGASSTFAF